MVNKSDIQIVLTAALVVLGLIGLIAPPPRSWGRRGAG